MIKRGDIVIFDDKHRLMCGDSTKEEDVKLLLNCKKMDLLVTDPPYNINYKGVQDKRNIKNDKMNDDDFIIFLKKTLLPCKTSYVFCSWQNAHLFREALIENNMKPKALIVWNKIIRVQNLDKYYKQHELIWYYGKFGGEETIRGDIWDFQREMNTIHPTMKPIKLLDMILKDNKNDIYIYDPFAGSGSTLISSIKNKKICFTMEIDENYCDKIIRRYYDYTFSKNIKIWRGDKVLDFEYIKKELKLLNGTTKKGIVTNQTRLF